MVDIYPDNFFSDCDINPNIVFDIGSNNPFNVFYKLKKFNPKNFYSFEADPDVFAIYDKHKLPDNLKFYNYAINNENGFVSFYKSKERHGRNHNYSGSILAPNIEAQIKTYGLTFYDKPIIVPCIRIDSFCHFNNIHSIDFMHIDVQGAEKRVIEGIGNLPVKMIFAEICEFDKYECGHDLKDFLEFMNSNGFIKVKDYGNDYLFLKK